MKENPELTKDFTDNEIAFLEAFIPYLDCGEPDYSDVQVNDLAVDLGWTTSKTKGVLGSLVKKKVCHTASYGQGIGEIIYLHDDFFPLIEGWEELWLE